MSLTWEKRDNGLGYETHVALGTKYTVHPEDLDVKHWSAWCDKEQIGNGTWQQCRKICETHAAEPGRVAAKEKFSAARAALMSVAGQIALHGHLKPEETEQPDEIVAAHNVGVDRAITYINRAIKALDPDTI